MQRKGYLLTKDQMNQLTSQDNKERKLQTILGIAVTAIVALVLIGIGVATYLSHQRSQHSEENSYTSLQQISQRPSNANPRGGILLSVYGHTPKGIPTIEIYVDPLCPACGQVDRVLNPTMEKLFSAGQINIELHPIAFLDNASSDAYSTRASAALAYVASHDPKHLILFMGKLYEQDFQPSETSYTSTGDSRIAAQAMNAGVNSDTARKCISGEYKEWVTASTAYTLSRKELQVPSRGGFATPLFRINQHIWSMGNTQLSELPDALLKSISLPKADLGNPNIKPAVGSTGKPSD